MGETKETRISRETRVREFLWAAKPFFPTPEKKSGVVGVVEEGLCEGNGLEVDEVLEEEEVKSRRSGRKNQRGVEECEKSQRDREVLGVYEWLGVNPVPPEFWLLPTIGPIHPGKMMCYCRLVYMPMSYIYGKRFVGPITKLIQSLREELYTKPYHEINWNKARNTVIKEDLYYPHPTVQDMLWGFLHHVVEPILTYWPFSNLRENALKRAIELVHYEDEASRYLTLGCVEKVLCMLACWIEDPNSEAYKCHVARVPDYYWVAEDGLKIVATPGYPGWDVAFAIQAIVSSNLVDEYWPTLRKAHDFLKASQIQEDPPGNFSERYRHITKGSWSFATKDHGWQSCDTTAEALKATLLLSQMPQELVGEKMDANHFYDAVNVLLYLQSANGGFPAWEPQRAFRWLEKFNPTEFIQDVIIEAEYVELTSSVVQSLVLFRKLYPTHRTNEIESCIKNAIHYIEETQNPDGSWYGNWGICYTYGTMFAIEALNCCGKNYQNSFAMRKACEFLLSKQLPSGGWGESYLSCSNKVYTYLEGKRTNLIQTAWATLALIFAGQADIDAMPIHQGIKVLIDFQMEDGDFPEQEITGIYFKNCVLNYSFYRNIFTIRALGEYQQHFHLGSDV